MKEIQLRYNGYCEENGGWVSGYLIYNEGSPFIVGDVVESNEDYIALEYWWPVDIDTLTKVQVSDKIELTNTERGWIKLCKGHFKDKYPHSETWIDTIRLYYSEVYGNNLVPGTVEYPQYLDAIFNVLFGIYMKIKDDKSGIHAELRDLFKVTFNKTIIRSHDLPVERAISELCGLIQTTAVIVDGSERFEL